MQENSIYSYYAFGFNYRGLKTFLKGSKVKMVVQHLELYIKTITQLELVVTSQIIEPLKQDLENLRKLEVEIAIPADIAARIDGILIKADASLDAELKLKKVLSVTPKRFHPDMLLKTPSALLANGCWDALSGNAKLDFADATRCIALNLPTAAAFHLMRSAEECVKHLYHFYVKNNRMEHPMWGPMISKLREKNKPRPAKELLDHLDMIRANYRNPTQHPEKFYSIDEAQDLLNNSIVALNAITRDIDARGKPAKTKIAIAGMVSSEPVSVPATIPITQSSS